MPPRSSVPAVSAQQRASSSSAASRPRSASTTRRRAEKQPLGHLEAAGTQSSDRANELRAFADADRRKGGGAGSFWRQQAKQQPKTVHRNQRSTTTAGTAQALHNVHIASSSSTSSTAAPAHDHDPNRYQASPVTLTQRLPDAIGLLVTSPLEQFQAELRAQDAEEMHDSGSMSSSDSSSPRTEGHGLRPLVGFIRRLLRALHELQKLFQASSSAGLAAGANATMSWLVGTRDELSLWGRRAGRAIRSLAAGTVEGLGGSELRNQLQTLQDSISEACKRVTPQYDMELSEMHEASRRAAPQYDTELAEIREDLRQTKSSVAAAAAEASQAEEVGQRNSESQKLESFFERKLEEQHFAEEKRWQSMREEVACSRVELVDQLTEQHQKSIRQLTEFWAGQAAQRDREIQFFRERAEAAVVEMQRSQGAAKIAHAKSVSEKQAMAAAEARFQDEFEAERLMHCQSLVKAREAADNDVDIEKKEKSSLTLQLTEAMTVLSSRDRDIEELRSSLSDQLEKARSRPPIQTALTPTALGNAGPVPPSWPVVRAQSTAARQAGSEDGTSSVCRVSTDSSPFVRASRPAGSTAEFQAAVPPLPRRRTVSETSAATKKHFEEPLEEPSTGAGALPSPKPATKCPQCGNIHMQDAPFCRQCGLKRDVEASVSLVSCVGSPMSERTASTSFAAAPWEMPPHEFLAMWRRSRGVLSSSTPLPGDSSTTASTGPAEDVGARQAFPLPHVSAEKLKITASLE